MRLGGLPTESEWEYAARGGKSTRFWWGEEAGKNNANCSGCGKDWGGQRTAPVGSFSENPFKLHDTAGNVWEWVEDCWHGNYVNAPQDGSAWGEANGEDCAQRVIRGGSWLIGPRNVRSASRFGLAPDALLNDLGFRLAQDI